MLERLKNDISWWKYFEFAACLKLFNFYLLFLPASNTSAVVAKMNPRCVIDINFDLIINKNLVTGIK